MAFIVTGTPGTGKTTFARKLAQEKHYEYLDLAEFARAVGAIEGKDTKRDTDIVNEDIVIAAITKALEKNNKVVIDSHFSHDIPAARIEKCYVTKCDLKELKSRLEKRGYSEKKVQENLDAEIFDTCKLEAEDNGHTVEVINT